MEMALNKARVILEANIKEQHNTLLVGAPGVGKTDIYTQIANDLGMQLIVTHPVVSDPTDFKGMPWVAPGAEEAKFLPFGDLAKLVHADQPTLVLMDDIGQAPPAVQAALMQLLLKREIDGKKISDKVTFAAATNRREDRAGVSGMLEPVKSRFATILHVTPDFDSWKKWAYGVGDIDEAVIAYLNQFPTHLHMFEPTADITNTPCPRTWAALSKQVKLNLPQKVELYAYAGAVGEGEATQFTQFRRIYQELPTWEDIINAPDVIAVPKQPSALYATATMVAFRVDKKNFKDAIKFIYRLPEEFGVLTIRDMVRKTPGVVNTPEWMRFLSTDLGKMCTGNDD